MTTYLYSTRYNAIHRHFESRVVRFDGADFVTTSFERHPSRSRAYAYAKHMATVQAQHDGGSTESAKAYGRIA